MMFQSLHLLILFDLLFQIQIQIQTQAHLADNKDPPIGVLDQQDNKDPPIVVLDHHQDPPIEVLDHQDQLVKVMLINYQKIHFYIHSLSFQQHGRYILVCINLDYELWQILELGLLNG